MEQQQQPRDKFRIISEDGVVTISIKALLSAMAGLAFLVASHYQVSNKINRLESQIALMSAEVHENRNWIKDYKPSKAFTDSYNRLRLLESHVRVLEERISHLSD